MAKSSVLFDRITCVTPLPEGGVQVLDQASVAVEDGRILYVGTQSDQAKAAFKPGTSFQVYQGRHKILWPSMVNTHGHVPMTLMRNQADDHNLHDWLFNLIFPREEKLTREHVYYGSLLGMAEMIRSGTGTAADMYYFSEAVAEAAVQSGFRMNISFDGKAAGPDGRSHLNRDSLQDFYRTWNGAKEDLIQVALMVHSVYLYEPYLYQELSDAVHDVGCFVQVHVSETAREVQECLTRYGKRPPAQLEAFGLFDGPTVAAHCVHLDDQDREILAARKVLAAHNPSSNLKLGSGIADLAAMLKAGVSIGLGTDGAASNNNLNLYQEMRLASFLAKGTSGDASVLPAPDLIRMATLNGARGLGFNQSGCICPGWQADLQVVDADRPAMWPLGNPAAALVYSCEGNFVESLMVQGRWLMEKGELKTIDEEKVRHAAFRLSESLA